MIRLSRMRNKLIKHTSFTVQSNKAHRTSTSIRSNSVKTCSSIVARAFFAIVNIYQESNMSALNVFEAMPKMSWCTNNYMNILILQSSPVNPRLQLQVKLLIPSTQTPPFRQGLVRQSSISGK